MKKTAKQKITLRLLRKCIKYLRNTDCDGSWTIKARDLCSEAFVQMPKKHMIKIAEEVPIDNIFMQDMIKTMQNMCYSHLAISGKDAMMVRAIEELAELTQSLTKAMRNKEDIDNIKEEIADVENSLALVKCVFNLETDTTIQKLQYLKMYRELVRLGKVSNSEREAKLKYLTELDIVDDE